jgi:hypothetical protein
MEWICAGLRAPTLLKIISRFVPEVTSNTGVLAAFDDD